MVVTRTVAAVLAMTYAACSASARDDRGGVGESCAQAFFLSPPTFTQTFAISGSSAGSPPGSCNFFAATLMQNDTWAHWIAAVDGTMVLAVSTEDAFRPIVQVHTGASCGTLLPIDCDSEADGLFSVSFPVTANTPYYFQFGKYGTTPAPAFADITLSGFLNAANDRLENAQVIECGQTIFGDLRTGSSEPSDPPFDDCVPPQPNEGFNSLWYRFTITTETFRLIIRPAPGTNVYPQAQIFSDPAHPGCALTSALGPGFPLIVTGEFLSSSIGQTRYLVVTAAADASGNIGPFELTLDCPVQEICFECPAGARTEIEMPGQDLNGGCASSSTAFEDLLPGETVCGHAIFRTSFDFDFDWYSISVPTRSTLFIQTFANFPLVLNLFPGSCPVSTPISTLAPSSLCDTDALTISVEAGQYFFQVKNSSAAFTDYWLKYTATPETPACTGDADGDGRVGLSDIAVVISNWNTPVPPGPAAADLDGSGGIDLGDLAVIIRNWGVVCTSPGE